MVLTNMFLYPQCFTFLFQTDSSLSLARNQFFVSPVKLVGVVEVVRVVEVIRLVGVAGVVRLLGVVEVVRKLNVPRRTRRV